ncbi:MAG: hypothetical protein ISS33_00390 [Candidatus Omnitrophica bacterium]|nr:hypothetical protein [Candidatus Omnitrophota bacterium]
MGKILSLMVGTIVVIGGVILLINWWGDLIYLLKGCIPILLIIGGGISILAGISEIKDTKKIKPASK